jgi:hypothetical protein
MGVRSKIIHPRVQKNLQYCGVRKNSIEKKQDRAGAMKFLKNLSIFVLLILVGSIQLAPVEDTKNVYSVIKTDKRFVKLLSQPFVKECENQNRPICSALLDIALRFDEPKLDFIENEITSDADFCNNQLLKVLPDAPTSPYTSSLLKSFNITWFKDTLKEKEDKCSNECVYWSFELYRNATKPVCFFIYDQYKFLETQASEVKIGTEKSVTAYNASGGEQLQQQKGERAR